MVTNGSIERWDVFEITLTSKKTFARPFHDVTLTAVFTNGGTKKKVNGFYDGGCVWKIRFMPEELGEYRFSISSSNDEFNGLEGSFISMEPSQGNHGPARVDKKYHFSFADRTPFFVMGTTAYVWHYRPEEIRKKTLESFVKYGFNKIRMLFFPKHYVSELHGANVSYEPPCYPFAGEPNNFDFKTPNPEYFRNFEDRVKELMELGIQADVILFHVYDSGHWGIDTGMDNEDDMFYIHYLVSRLAAYRNVWWSLGNEYNLFFHTDNVKSNIKKSMDGWSIIGGYVKLNDPYGHPISVHNFPYLPVYPNRDWMTHVSYQHPNTYSMLLDLKNKYGKPVINDEYQYEGNIRDEWGNSPAELEVFRHWLTAMAGGYGTHGEAFIIDGNNRDIFWSYGGTMIGESAPRLKYMKEILESCPYQEMEPDFTYTDGQNSFGLSDGKGVSLYFIRRSLPGKRLRFGFFQDESVRYEATVYDVWNCTIKEKAVVKPDHKFETTDWTVIKLVKKDKTDI